MRGDEVIQDVAVLLLERRHHRHHTLNKASACRALRAKAAFAPWHAWMDRPFRRIVGGLNAFDLHEGPQRLTALQNLPTRSFGFGYPTLAPGFEEPLDIPSKRRHIGTKRRSLQGAFAHPVPPRKH